MISRNDPPVKYAVQKRDEQHSQVKDEVYRDTNTLHNIAHEQALSSQV